MTPIRYVALPTDAVRNLQNGGMDANGMSPEMRLSDGQGNPCRHCLNEIAKDEEMLILAYRPFPALQPYAELGPIFLHAAPCSRHPEAVALPAMFRGYARMLVRGYGRDDRIRYGTGRVVDIGELDATCATLLGDPEVAYLHLRSAANNCYQCRVERA